MRTARAIFEDLGSRARPYTSLRILQRRLPAYTVYKVRQALSVSEAATRKPSLSPRLEIKPGFQRAPTAIISFRMADFP